MDVVWAAQGRLARLEVASLIAIAVGEVHAETFALPEVWTVQRVMDDVRPPVESPFSGVIASVRAGTGKNVRRVDHKLASFKGAALVPPRDSQVDSSENAQNRCDYTSDRKEIPQCTTIR